MLQGRAKCLGEWPLASSLETARLASFAFSFELHSAPQGQAPGVTLHLEMTNFARIYLV